MADQQIQLEVVTPSRQLLSEKVDSIELPGKDGYLGILPGHAPLLTQLGIGVLAYSQSGTAHYATVMEGFAEVLGDRVIVLADAAELAHEIDPSRAQSAAERAEAEIAKAGHGETDWHAASLALQRALARQEAVSKSGTKPS
jgi:F-type H+-transporting ATPase subunit epsilon